MADIVFPVSSAPGAKPQEGSGRLVNCYAVKTEQGARKPILWRRAAGLRELTAITGHSHCRGFLLVGSTLLVVLDQRVYAVTYSGGVFSKVNLGELPGTDRVTLARDNAATPDLVANCDAGLFNLYLDSAPDSFSDGDMPALSAVTGANGYIVGATAAGALWTTDLNNVGVQSDADEETQMIGGLLRPVYFRDELFAMGPNGIAVYDETGATPFPFQYKKVRIEPGLIGKHAVAGFELGWKGSLCWVAPDNIVYRLDGYTPVPISNDDVSRAIATASDRSAIETCVYMDGRNAFLVITSPGEWSHEYNLTTDSWNERESYQRSDWRARCTIKAFDMWIAGDATTGKLMAIDNTYYREAGNPLIWQLESGANADFPSRIAIGPAFFDFTAAVAVASGQAPIETNPSVLISWSFDGGYTWGNPVQRRLGLQGDGDKLVDIRRCGSTKAKGIRFRLVVADPVHVGFMGGTMPQVQKRAA
jgi:hypothetical protein